jgi:hypothetical protein
MVVSSDLVVVKSIDDTLFVNMNRVNLNDPFSNDEEEEGSDEDSEEEGSDDSEEEGSEQESGSSEGDEDGNSEEN